MKEMLSGENSEFLNTLYRAFQKNPDSLEEKWQRVFRDMGQIECTGHSEEKDIIDSIRALMMIRAYRVRGHLAANLDPLGIDKPKKHAELDPENYGFTENDYNTIIYLDNVLGLKRATLGIILERIKKTYCGTIGVEFMHIQDPEKKAWIQEHIENSIKPKFDTKDILTKLTRAELFEKFLNVKFPGAKRFGLEGGESLIPALEQVIDVYSKHEVKEICIGMSHRGRLSVLANIMQQPARQILELFQGHGQNLSNYKGSGDVKYHIGYSSDRVVNQRKIHLSLSANPSHLEAVDPVVLGKVRAKQDLIKDNSRKRIAGILLHGDAAFAGQGLVAETLSLCGLKGYETGGTLHLIINNQIGFTTTPPHSRSSPYSSDIAKATQAPIFHVNADHPEDVIWVSFLAAEYVRTFGVDAVIDMICYRRFGHNEMDEPAFTQPIMYKNIETHPTTKTIYANYLLATDQITKSEQEDIEKNILDHLNRELLAVSEITEEENKHNWPKGSWSKITSSTYSNNTGIQLDELKKLGLALCETPENFSINPKLKRQLDQRKQAIHENGPIDWTTAEALAFATLLKEGIKVRLSGQDSCRGTFSQRHAVIFDQKNEQRFLPLNNLGGTQAIFEVIDSPLAEASILGFEYGYSTASPDALAIWEAQFGDFANGAQVIIDQFISSAEKKWSRLSGLVMMLPHGMEGQGPEHSSARLERYLQLCAEDNLHVVNCTTPANFFHVLRRQIHNSWRKPLIAMTPKSLLRHKLAVSNIQDFSEGASFQPVIPDHTIKKASRIILCSGKVYYDLLEARTSKQIDDIPLIRIEEYYPFPSEYITKAITPYGDVPIIWCQEEARNGGAWQFLDRRLENALKQLGHQNNRPLYVGRPEAASPATGIADQHAKEQQAVIDSALFESLQNIKLNQIFQN